MGFISPLTPPYDLVESGWGSDRSYRGPGAVHEGIDFRAPIGTPVRAVDSGVVRAAFLAPDGNAGYMMEIAHPSGYVSRYLHLNSFRVPVGSRVSQGQIVATTGETGSAKGDPHLHFDMRANASALAEYTRRFGTPGPSGFPPHGAEWAVPSEALIPARYSSAVMQASTALGVKFAAATGAGSAKSGSAKIAAGIGIAALAIVGIGLGISAMGGQDAAHDIDPWPRAHRRR